MARRGENIYKRKDGRWEGRYICSYNDLGHAKYRSVYAYSYKDVKAKLTQINSNPVLAEHNLPSDTLQMISSEWLDAVKLRNKDSTYCKYQNVCKNHILPELGRFPICKISTVQVERFVEQLNHKPLSAKTLLDILSVLKRIFSYAEDCGYKTICNFNFIAIKQDYKEMRVLSHQEQSRLIEFLLDNTDPIKLGIYLSLYTGIRIGELCAITWGDISLDNKTLDVSKTMQRIQIATAGKKTSVVITEPKSRCSRRVIPLPDFVVAKLTENSKSIDKNTFLLSGSSDKYIEPRNMQYYFKKCIQECEIEAANFHCLRHTFATRCIEAGFEIKSLSEILGHSSVNITLNRYVHSSLDLKRANMEKLSLI